jgi:glyceraldehyde 3-phosphate dehydrogenase
MTIKVAINGFGRIGRLVYRLLAKEKNISIVAINDLVPAENLAYLLRYDSTHGIFDLPVFFEGETIHVAHHRTQVYAERNPQDLPWKNKEIDCVIEATGLFLTKEKASLHLKAGAKRVILTAPAKEGIKTIVMGVNHQEFNKKEDLLVSNASCTTNCLAPLAKILLDTFGIEEGLMTTIHAITSSQPTVDGPSHKDLRAGRSALQNIIPASTGAAKAVSLVLPELAGKLTGMAFRVPTPCVSVVDLTVKIQKPSSFQEVCQAIEHASKTNLKNIVQYSEENLVSTDLLGNLHSSIFDKGASIALNDKFFKLVSWYDNEMGYAARVKDLLLFMEG